MAREKSIVRQSIEKLNLELHYFLHSERDREK